MLNNLVINWFRRAKRNLSLRLRLFFAFAILASAGTVIIALLVQQSLEITSISDQAIKYSQSQSQGLDQALVNLALAQQLFYVKAVSAVAILLLLSVFLAWSFQKHMIVPLGRLEAGVKEIAGGRLDYRIDVIRQDEIGIIAAEFNNVTESLSKSYFDLERRFSQLTNLYQISKAVSVTNDIDDLLNQALRQSLDLMGAESGSIMLLVPESDELKICAAVGLDQETIDSTRVKLGEGISGRVAAEGKALMIQDDVRKAHGPGVKDVTDALSVPLIVKDRVIGVINANNKDGERFDEEDLRFFTTLAGQIAAAVANATLVDDIQEAYFNTIKVLAAAIDAKDKYTHGHSERVAKYSVTIARQMGLSPEDLTRIEAAAYLHDIGKIGVPDQVLNKNGRLTDEEMDKIKRHPVEAAEILGLIDFPWGDVVPGVRGHHERCDGKGYPDGLADDGIPPDARIIAVADSYDAMTSDRPYRKGLEKTKAVTELVNGRGSQFDGQAVDAFIPALLSEWMSSVPGLLVDNLELLTTSSSESD